MKGRLLSVGGLVVLAVLAVVATGDGGSDSSSDVPGEEWRPVASDPENVVVWGETWSYAESGYDAPEGEPVYPTLTARRPPAQVLILVPVSEVETILASLESSGLRDQSEDYQLLTDQVIEWQTIADAVPAARGRFLTQFQHGGMSGDEAGSHGWPTTRLDPESGRFSLEVPPGAYVLCLDPLPSGLWRCLGHPLEFTIDTPMYFTTVELWVDLASHNGFFHVGVEESRRVKDAIDGDELLITIDNVYNTDVYPDLTEN